MCAAQALHLSWVYHTEYVKSRVFYIFEIFFVIIFNTKGKKRLRADYNDAMTLPQTKRPHKTLTVHYMQAHAEWQHCCDEKKDDKAVPR